MKEEGSEEKKGKGPNPWATREEPFPDFWWEPRWIDPKRRGKPPMAKKCLEEEKFTKRNWTWNLSAVGPLMWYSSQVCIDEEALIPRQYERWGKAGAKDTVWQILSWDFQFATGEVLGMRDAAPGTAAVSTITRMFTSATCNLSERFGVEQFTKKKESAQRTALQRRRGHQRQNNQRQGPSSPAGGGERPAV